MIGYSLQIICSFGLAAFLYIAFRSDEVLINHVLNQWGLRPRFELKPPGEFTNFLVYTLPQGLWLYGATLLSFRSELAVMGKKVILTHLPLILFLLIELWQFIGWSNGTFEMGDLVTMIFCWTIALLYLRKFVVKGNLNLRFSAIRGWISILLLFSVFLSDVK